MSRNKLKTNVIKKIVDVNLCTLHAHVCVCARVGVGVIRHLAPALMR